MPDTEITRDEIESTLEARRELGAEMEPAVVDAFADRVERVIDARVANEVARRGVLRDDGTGFVLAVVSLGTGIPITAIAADTGGMSGLLIGWLGIVGVNVAYRLKR